MIIIDPSKGGENIGINANGIVEKDFNLLISEYIYNRLKELGADVTIIRDSDETISLKERANKMLNTYGNNSRVIAISNTLDGDGKNVQIVYALRNNDTLAKAIKDNMENNNIIVDKYYQRRSETDTSKDYYDIQRDTGNIQTIVIDYGNINDINVANDLKNNYKKYAESVIKAISNYKGIPYYIEGEFENEYIVKKGDSLYSISKQYATTVDELKKINNLKTNNLSIGQILKIPSIQSTDINQTYIVQSGDSLYKISKDFNTTVDEIKKLNNLSSNLLQIGQILKIPVSADTNTYTVKKGDSLYSIAIKYNTTVDELKRINNLNSNLLSIDQILKIPNTNDNVYIVKKGDSLYSIANKYNTTVNRLKEINNLSSNLLQIGQQLKITN